MGTLHEDLCTFMIISPWIVLRMRHVLEKIKTYILCSIIFFSENRVVCERMWKKHKMLCCVSTSIMVMWTGHKVMLYVHCVSCYEVLRDGIYHISKLNTTCNCVEGAKYFHLVTNQEETIQTMINEQHKKQKILIAICIYLNWNRNWKWEMVHCFWWKICCSDLAGPAWHW
jgi:hypothetical protein